MPTYEYKCNECDHTFDVFQSIKDDPVLKCENCGGKVKRLIGAAGIIFKGSGFYVNDYKKKENSNKSADLPKKEKVKSGAECASCSASKSCPASADN